MLIGRVLIVSPPCPFRELKFLCMRHPETISGRHSCNICFMVTYTMFYLYIQIWNNPWSHWSWYPGCRSAHLQGSYRILTANGQLPRAAVGLPKAVRHVIDARTKSDRLSAAAALSVSPASYNRLYTGAVHIFQSRCPGEELKDWKTKPASCSLICKLIFVSNFTSTHPEIVSFVGHQTTDYISMVDFSLNNLLPGWLQITFMYGKINSLVHELLYRDVIVLFKTFHSISFFHNGLF